MPREAAEIQALLDSLVESGSELGIQVAAYHEGELVVDAWAGTADRASGDAVDGRTLFPVFSVSKGIVATAVHVLVDRGVLAYRTRLAEVWPEFGSHGKDTVTVAHLLEHSAGVPYFPAGLSPDDLLDRERVTALIADTEPAWPAGTKTGYHSLTFGYLVAETIRRATGRTLEEVVRDDLATPLGIADELYIVPPASEVGRLADIDDTAFTATLGKLPGGTAFHKAIGGLSVSAIVPRRTVPPGRSWQVDAPLPFGATMTARAGARLYAALAGGGELDGVRLLSAGTLAEATRIRRRDHDEILGAPTMKSWGYANGDPVSGGREAAFGFGGLGGAEAYADPQHRLSFAFTHNRLTPPTDPDNAPQIAAEVRRTLGVASSS
nr:serine hydrolase domain-containing protein [Kibdelosporangium sp. MJ126-NF4]CEL13144.1 Esterase A [Kibdelosporangium sp. MJ126-NF4]CTQ98832.1 Esterase A [Kibdelosporangium sp. MJ126-NF4]